MTFEAMTDAELVRQFKAGDEQAFDAIVLRFQDRVFRLASLWLHDRQNAADAAQEVFVRGYKGLRSFRFRATPFTWLYRTTRLVCHEFNRRRPTETLEQEPIAAEPSQAQQLQTAETITQVRALVASLPERQREVVFLRLFEELSVRDTASAMGCREGTVKALLHKAMANLKTRAASLNLDGPGEGATEQ